MLDRDWRSTQGVLFFKDARDIPCTGWVDAPPWTTQPSGVGGAEANEVRIGSGCLAESRSRVPT